MPRGVQADPLDSPRWGVTEHDRAQWIDGLRVKMAFSTDVHMDVRALFIDGMAWMIATMNEPPTIEDDVEGRFRIHSKSDSIRSCATARRPSSDEARVRERFL